MRPVAEIVRSATSTAPMKPDELQEHIASTYFTLRLGIVLASFLLPLVVFTAGSYRTEPRLLPSISDYYVNGTNFTRDWFVGTLCAVGVFLYLYKGYSPLENVLLNVAGVLGIVVALVPCRCGDVDTSVSVHGFAAVAFFVSMAFVSIRCAPNTLSLMKNTTTKNKFKHRYKILGIVMIASPLIAVVVSLLFGLRSQVEFFVEAFGIWTFAAYWIVKSRELSATQAENLSLKGKAEKLPGGNIVAVGDSGVPTAS